MKTIKINIIIVTIKDKYFLYRCGFSKVESLTSKTSLMKINKLIHFVGETKQTYIRLWHN